MHKNKFIYRHIHAIHHQSSAPYPLDILYVNPLETLFVSIAILMSFVAVYFIFGSINIYVFWGYQLFRIFHETDVHSGIKSIIFKWLPFYGSAEHHDSHHSNLNGNYASTFSFWDHMLGTKIKNKKN
jgi:methylsterol monooxygenase